MTNRSWRVDETYLRIAGQWTYLYRAGASTGATIDFLLSVNRDADAAKCFFQKALRSPSHPRPRVGEECAVAELLAAEGKPEPARASYRRGIEAAQRVGPSWFDFPLLEQCQLLPKEEILG